MKGHLLAGAAIAALIVAHPAHAADLPLKAPAAVAAVWTWSGFYIGIDGGYGWGHNFRSDVTDPFFTGKFPGFGPIAADPKGFLGGIHAGANWQTGRIVAGFEGDLSATDMKASALNTVTTVSPFVTNTGTFATSGTFDLLGSARARLGYVVTPNVLLYGTGGLAWTRFVESTNMTAATVAPPPFAFTATQFSFASNPSWRFGWVAGVGAETRLFDTNWLARLEYLHYDFGGGSSSLSFDPVGGLPVNRSRGDLTADVVRAGISYKFDPDRFALGFAGVASPTPGLSYKAPPVVMPWSWSGFYLGANAGYGWAHDPFTSQFAANGVPLNGLNGSGYVGGFQAGANWQSGSLVGGLEIDLSTANIKGATTNAVSAAAITSQATQIDRFDELGSTRARFGFLMTPNILLYGTGGLGWTHLQTEADTTTTGFGNSPTFSTAPTWMFGWVAGFGAEMRIANTNWIARAEYLHYDFGNSGSTTVVTPLGAPVPALSSSSGIRNIDVARAGVSYKFDWPGVSGGPYASTGGGPYDAMAAMPPVAPVFSWSGFYLGGHGGYGWGRDTGTILATAWEPAFIDPLQGPQTVVGQRNLSGALGGFQAGANWQYQSIVGGLEIDLSSTDINGSASARGLDTGGAPVSQTNSEKFDLLGSGRARLGYLVTPSILLYGTGGWAWTRLDRTSIATNSDGTFTTEMPPSWRFGWVAGAGGEARLWNTNWLARVEYLHYDFGSGDTSLQGFGDGLEPTFITSQVTSHHLTTDVVRAGVSYKLN